MGLKLGTLGEVSTSAMMLGHTWEWVRLSSLKEITPSSRGENYFWDAPEKHIQRWGSFLERAQARSTFYRLWLACQLHLLLDRKDLW